MPHRYEPKPNEVRFTKGCNTRLQVLNGRMFVPIRIRKRRNCSKCGTIIPACCYLWKPLPAHDWRSVRMTWRFCHNCIVMLGAAKTGETPEGHISHAAAVERFIDGGLGSLTLRALLVEQHIGSAWYTTGWVLREHDVDRWLVRLQAERTVDILRSTA